MSADNAAASRSGETFLLDQSVQDPCVQAVPATLTLLMGSLRQLKGCELYMMQPEHAKVPT